MFPRWLKKSCPGMAHLHSLLAAEAGRARSGGRRCRPVLEVLEDRLAPATYPWNNANGGDWDTVGNWSVGGVTAGQLPGAGDDVVIGALNGSSTVTHSQNTT